MIVLRNDEYTAGLLLDLSEAFDTVNHAIVLSKVSHYGVRGIAIELFRSYSPKRNQVVKLDVASHKK